MYAVNLVTDNLPVSDPKLKVISENETLTNLRDNLVRMARKETEIHQELKSYWNSCDELSEVRSVILKGNKIVIPASLRKKCLRRFITVTYL